jgi:hypothetical protein
MLALQTPSMTAARMTQAAPPPSAGWSGGTVAGPRLPPPPAPSGSGLVWPTPSAFERGTTQVPPGAMQVASYTGASSGGAPGATFGPPGVASAPVILGVELTPLVLVGLGVGAFVLWRVLR